MASIGGPNIVKDGLVLALDAGAVRSYPGSGTTVYSLESSISGSLTNGTTFSSDNGGIFTFDGVDDRIENFSEDIQPSVITIEFWKKWTTLSDDWLLNNQTSNVTNTSFGYQTRIDSPSYNFYVRFGVGSSNRTVTYNPIILNQWAHVTATYDPVSEGAKLYWNGQLEGTNTGTGAIDYTGVEGLGIGGANDGSRDTPGPVGPIRIYNRVLTAEEVQQNYKAQKSRFGL